MKTIFDKSTREELIHRINTLNENSIPLWGKMNVYQMLKHCTLWEEMIFGKNKYKRVFIGYLFGRMALRNILKNEAPLRRNTPTIPELIIKEKNNDIIVEKKKWILMIEAYENFSNEDLIHPFFGKMTREQIGYFVYKHTDHHLRQFQS
jgi:hypothetical protein